jgi:ComF family protein
LTGGKSLGSADRAPGGKCGTGGDSPRGSAGGRVISILYPRRCPVCGGITEPEGALICAKCRPLLSDVREPLCRKCGKEIGDEREEYCADCLRHRKSFVGGVSLFNYNAAASESMSAVKYRNRREYLDFYADEAVRRLGDRLLAMRADALIPVPVHPSRRKKRGFNQAEVLADKIGERLGIPVVCGFLLRTRKTVPQKELGPEARLKNLEQAFTAAGPAPEGLRTVILIDDIYTTGSTIEACTRVLMRAGVKKVFFFTVCIGHGM